MFLALPYYRHSFAKTVQSCFLYTTQGDAEDAELQESVYRNDTQILSVYRNDIELTDLVHDTFLSLFV